MWRIEEHRRVDRQLSGAVPLEILKHYEKWKDIAALSGPPGYAPSRDFTMNPFPASGKGIVRPVLA